MTGGNAVIDNSPLSRGEALWVSRWMMEQKGIKLNGGFYSVLRLTPSQIAEDYKLNVLEILTIARRVQEEKHGSKIRS